VKTCRAAADYGLFSVLGLFSALLGESVMRIQVLEVDCPPWFSGKNMVKSLFL